MAELHAAFSIHGRAGWGVPDHPEVRSGNGLSAGIISGTCSEYRGIELHALPADCVPGGCGSRADRADVGMDLRELSIESVHIAFRANPAIPGLSRPVARAWPRAAGWPCCAEGILSAADGNCQTVG